MQKAIAILLLLLFTVANTELGQITRLPLLVQHYYTHQQKETPLTLLHFLMEHYQPGHADDDLAEDGQLPFKSYNSQHLFAEYVPVVIVEAGTPHAKMLQISFADYYSHHIIQRSYSVFHPPKPGKHVVC